MTCHGCGGALPERARRWCSERCRKTSYGDPCVDCGTRTRFGAEQTRIPEPRCRECATARRTMWTRERILAAIREWATVYGEPPCVSDWNPYQARHRLDEDRARRYEAHPGRWPRHSTVYRAFGSWNTALIAAGYVPRAPHGGDGNRLRARDARRRTTA